MCEKNLHSVKEQFLKVLYLRKYLINEAKISQIPFKYSQFMFKKKKGMKSDEMEKQILTFPVKLIYLNKRKSGRKQQIISFQFLLWPLLF